MSKPGTGGAFKKNDPRINRGGREKTYPNEAIDFIRANTGRFSDSELSKKINRLFNLNTGRQSIKSLRRYYKIIKGRDKYKPCPELAERTNRSGYVKIKAAGQWVNKHAYLWEQAHGKKPEGHTVIFLDGCKTNFSLDNLALARKAAPLLAEKTSPHGYVKIKTAAGQWEYKHRLIWKQANGPIPEGHNIIFADGNPLNCSLENLILVSIADSVKLTNSGLRFNDPELTQTGVAIVKLKNKLKEKKKQLQHF